LAKPLFSSPSGKVVWSAFGKKGFFLPRSIIFCQLILKCLPVTVFAGFFFSLPGRWGSFPFLLHTPLEALALLFACAPPPCVETAHILLWLFPRNSYAPLPFSNDLSSPFSSLLSTPFSSTDSQSVGQLVPVRTVREQNNVPIPVTRNFCRAPRSMVTARFVFPPFVGHPSPLSADKNSAVLFLNFPTHFPCPDFPLLFPRIFFSAYHRALQNAPPPFRLAFHPRPPPVFSSVIGPPPFLERKLPHHF